MVKSENLAKVIFSAFPLSFNCRPLRSLFSGKFFFCRKKCFKNIRTLNTIVLKAHKRKKTILGWKRELRRQSIRRPNYFLKPKLTLHLLFSRTAQDLDTCRSWLQLTQQLSKSVFLDMHSPTFFELLTKKFKNILRGPHKEFSRTILMMFTVHKRYGTNVLEAGTQYSQRSPQKLLVNK